MFEELLDKGRCVYKRAVCGVEGKAKRIGEDAKWFGRGSEEGSGGDIGIGGRPGVT